MSFSHVYGSCWTVWNGFAIFCRGFYSITATQFMFGIWWPPMFTYLYHSLCVLLFSFMVYFISWCLLMCYLCSFMFIYVHLFSFIFIYCHLFSFIFIFFHVLLFSSLEKTITNLNHLHVDPQLSSADIMPFHRSSTSWRCSVAWHIQSSKMAIAILTYFNHPDARPMNSEIPDEPKASATWVILATGLEHQDLVTNIRHCHWN